MKMLKQNHAVNLLFPLMVFFMFAASALAVLLLAARIYSGTTETLEQTEQRTTPLSYLTEKIRQEDEDGRIALETIEGESCLVLYEDYGGTECRTCIFEKDGALMELFSVASAEVPLSGAQRIMDSNGLTMEEPEEGLFRFTAAADDGSVSTVLAAERSRA